MRQWPTSSDGFNDVVYAELAAGFETRDELDGAIDEMDLRLAPMSRHALFLAGRAFLRYRSQRGRRPNVLADFFLGAHASAEVGRFLRATDGSTRATSARSRSLASPNVR
jgi:predicted nucleic acid-binding protein